MKDNEAISYQLVYFEDEKVDTLNNAPSYFLPKDAIEFKNLKTNKTKKIDYFYFDPNGMSESSWSRLGFSDKQIRVIKNYEAKGGRFYKKEDVAKIYVISDDDYTRIAPYIRIKEIINKPKVRSQVVSTNNEFDKSAYKKIITVNINSADTSDWKMLRGIGPVFANRIVKYRNALGGFTDISQIAEVYGIPSETIENIRPFLKLDNSTLIRRLNINTSTVDELSKHPYISRKQAQTIINYRFQHGYFTDLSSLLQIQSLDSDFLRIIEKYLEY